MANSNNWTIVYAMKEYPSIPSATGSTFFEFRADIFDKLEGQSIRVKWTKKKGFGPFGSRTRLFDESDEQFSEVIPLFRKTLEENLSRILIDGKHQKAMIFMEYWGMLSLGGMHAADDPKFLTIFDACLDNKGFLPPKDFRKLLEDKIPTAKYLGQVNWTRGFVESVRLGEVSCAFEGVVGKAKGTGGSLLMAKAKTQKWLDAIRAKFVPDQAERLIAS